MGIFINILVFLFLIKCFLFWLWLWQLKEYHWGRFRAHFETQAFKKFFSSFWRIKTPKITKKTLVISFFGFFFLAFLSYWAYSLSFLAFSFLIIFIPLVSSLIVLFFQIPTVILRRRILKKAREKREKFKNLLVIGITGSYGKTSTKDFLAKILAEKYRVLKTRENQNSEMGISQCILKELKKEDEIFVCEMGAYSKGGIKLLCEIARPKIGVVTGVNEQHLAVFGTMENLISAEGGKELAESLKNNSSKVLLREKPIEKGVIFLNAKNKHCLDLFQKIKEEKNIEKMLYGQEVKTAGLENIEGAKAIAKKLGMTEEEIEKGSQKIKNKFPGIKIKKGINNITLVDASYSANPTGVIAHLEYLKDLKGEKAIIMPCLIELGPASKEAHKKIGRKIGQVCRLAVITTKDRFKEIKEGLQEQNEKKTDIFLEEDPDKAFEKIKSFCLEGNIILLESRVPQALIQKLSSQK